MKKLFFTFLAMNLFSGNLLFAKSHQKGVQIPAEDLKWVANPDRPDEISMAVVWGDFQKGKHGAFHKFKAGTKVGVHTHSSTLYGVVVKGTFLTGPENAPIKLGPGSYLKDVPTDPHVTICEGTEECILYVHTSGKFDLKMAEKSAK